MKVDNTYRLEADPLVARLLGDIAEAAEYLQAGRYDDALTTLQCWTEPASMRTPNFGDVLAHRRAWADLIATMPAPFQQPLHEMPLQQLTYLIANARQCGNEGRDYIDLINDYAGDFGMRLVREYLDEPKPAS